MPGQLVAKGFKNGVQAATHEINTAETPYQIRLLADRTTILADGCDVSFVTVSVCDKDGNTVPDACNELFFHIEGNGRILGICSGNPGSHENEKGSVMKAFNGLCLAIIESTLETGGIVLTVTSRGLIESKMLLSSLKLP